MTRLRWVVVAAALGACGSPATRGGAATVERERPPPAESKPAPGLGKTAGRIEPAVAEAIARAELEKLVREHRVARAAIVILDPENGRILAAVGAGPDGDRQALQAVPTGSTMKTLTVAAALDAGLDPDRRFTGEDGQWRVGGTTIRDVSPSDWLDAERTLVRSSNIGAAKIAEANLPAVRDFLARLRWGQPVVRGAEPGAPALERWTEGSGFAHAAGVETRASPLFLAAAYLPFARRTGEFSAPTVEGTARREPVLQPYAAERIATMLTAAVEQGTGKGAVVHGMSVAGKTGTGVDPAGGLWGHFVGFAPVDTPARWLVGVSVYSTAGGYVGGTVAAPSFARLVRNLVTAAPQLPAR